MWIGAGLAFLGALAVFVSPLVGPLLSFREIEAKAAPTPADLSPIRHTFTWALQGGIVLILGAVMFFVSRSKLRSFDIAENSARAEDWGS